MNLLQIRQSILSIPLVFALLACGGVSSTPSSQKVDAINKISAYAEKHSNQAPTLQDYQDTGVQGVTASNLNRVNQAIDALEKEDVDSIVELQAIISKIMLVEKNVEVIKLIDRPAISNVNKNSATISWSLNHNATGQIEYGTTSSYGSFALKENSFKYNSHAQRLKNLKPNTTYHYRVISEDESGKKVMSGDNTFKTMAVDNETTDTLKPVISLLGRDTIHLIVGDSYVEEGATALDNKDGNISIKIKKTGKINTTIAGSYTIKYNVSDSAGNKASEVVRTIIIKARLTVKSLEITTTPNVRAIDKTQVTISWSLNHNATGQIEYGTTSSYGSFALKENSFKYNSHAQRLKNLKPNTTYHYRVISEDESGKKVMSGDNTFKTMAVDNGTFPVDSNAPIWIIGDSTVVNGGSGTPPRGGWGEFIPNLVKNGSRVRNKAVGGSTAKSFFTTYWDKVKQDITNTDTSKGAYLFIEFGHNDRDSMQDGNINKATVPGLGNEYDDYLMKYIDFARANNVIPVLVTGTASMCKDNCGSRTYIRIDSLPNIIPSPWKDMIGKVGDWPKTKIEVGAREDVTVLDLTTASVEHFASFDNTQDVRNQYAWKPQTNDDTHFNKVGARKMAELVKDLACNLDNGGEAMLCSQFKEDDTKVNALFPAETAMTPIATKSVKKLAVGESVVGPAFGGTITRMTGAGVRASGSKHPYAKTQAWNSDMSMIRLTFRLYDANTLKELSFTKGLSREAAYKKSSNGLSEIKWSSTNPNVFYGINVKESQFWKGTIDRKNNTIEFKMLHDFGVYKDFRLGPYEGNIDYNDKYVAFYAKKSGASYPTGIVYDIPNDKVVATKDLRDIEKIDWLSVDPRGEYIVLRDSANSGYKVYRYNLDLTNKKILASTAAHGDLGLDQNGDSIYVQWGFSAKGNNGVWMYRLKDLHKTKLMPSNYGSGHISCRNKDRKGWCYLSTQTEKYREVFAVKLSYKGADSAVVNRFAQTHESGTRSSVATVSPDGSRVIFMSDWGTKVDDYYDRSTYHVQYK